MWLDSTSPTDGEASRGLTGAALKGAWSGLRSLRSSPPALASRSDRKRVFTSALEQSEQLFAAAAAVEVATRPILAFYALSQAGRAIAAALADDPWRLHQHGIGIGGDATPGGRLASLTVLPQDSGSFGRIREILASSRLPEKTALGELWPLLVEAEPQPLSGGGEDRSLLITAETSMWAGGIPAMFVSNLPDWLARDVEMPPPYVATLGANYAAQADAVHTFLSRYPALSRCSPFRASGEPIGMYLHDDGTCSVLLQWDKQDVATASFAAVAASIGVRSRDGWRVYPSLDGGERPVHPLVVWWAVLFRLSMLARYEPEQWDRLTDVNSSRDAVPVEHLLREALSAVPALVLEVLTADHTST